MSTLPLTQKLPENNLFKMLNLPLSSKWPQVKRAYEMRMQELERQLKKSTPDADKAVLQREFNNLQQAYSAFAARISEKNADLYETREALKTLDLPDSSDWDAVNDRFETLRQGGQEQQYRAAFQQLEEQKTLITKDKRTGKTWIGAAVALGGVGISLAAYHTLNAQETSEMMAAAVSPATPQDITVTDPVPQDLVGPDLVAEQHLEPLIADGMVNADSLGIEALETDNLNQYIEEHYSVEDELLSMIGMVPDQLLSLTLERKMDVFASMIRSV